MVLVVTTRCKFLLKTNIKQVVLNIFSDLLHDCVELYKDDSIVYGNSYEESLTNLKSLLQSSQDMNLSLSDEKCFMLMNEGKDLGNHISSLGIEVHLAKIYIIQDLPIHQKTQDVRHCLGHASHCRRFIPNFSKTTTPLFLLLVKDENSFGLRMSKAFDTLKERLVSVPMLRDPNWDLPSHIHTNASENPQGLF